MSMVESGDLDPFLAGFFEQKREPIQQSRQGTAVSPTSAMHPRYFFLIGKYFTVFLISLFYSNYVHVYLHKEILS